METKTTGFDAGWALAVVTLMMATGLSFFALGGAADKAGCMQSGTLDAPAAASVTQVVAETGTQAIVLQADHQDL
ncbi:MAG: hypothetical protein Q4E12_00125 [Coriobacteriia bacterium]|nr:hypothetical protein [Coriobacteriia bacterium]